MTSKRERLANFCQRTGITRLLGRGARKPALLVLNYHRIGAVEDCLFDRGVFSASAEQFDEQVGFLKKSEFKITTLEEAQFLAEHPVQIKTFHVLITFDDGYIDNYEIAFPILKNHGVSAAFFLPTSFIGTTRVPWWDKIAWSVRNTTKSSFRLQYPAPRTFEPAAKPQEEIIHELLRMFKSREMIDSARFLRELEEACDVSVEESTRLFMTMEEAAEMLAGGMAIGSHTHSHELLGKQSQEQQVAELQTSQTILRSRLGIKADALAYPVGSRSSFSSDTYSAMRASGYRSGFSFYGGVNTPQNIDPLNILRIPVECGMSFNLFRMQTTAAAVSARTWF